MFANFYSIGYMYFCNFTDVSYALHLASKCCGGRVIEVLLAHKPPLNVFDSDGQTPLILAIKRENVEAVEALVCSSLC